ncbi:hypothetical protein PENANT_c024G03691 [Penicillium antarcticum]|uniref:Versicolorin reductase n=1 Tax=Penicillium antarcticum TaxID=416450 RepID=A0A1V6PZ61_9EURO|nr:uncharacterized protein N7508_005188 [Penicillium antarcticum]KAJ5306173.1 hypothetical protein N7508_005188 [Penicillium antarcticum]OQD82002.1 hypothetical protein PENANT_c024G03691 [Penicillium antarcticum]
MVSSAFQDLTGKVALVTGSSRGIGAATALRLAQRGASVAVNYFTSAQAAEDVAEHIRSCGVKAILVKADVSQEADIKLLFQTVVDELGRIDVVFSNSGIEHFGALPAVAGEEIDHVFAVNVKAQFFVAQQSHKHMADHGRLILMSSVSAQKGFPGHAIYAASKAAIQGMVRCLAFDFGSRNITVNAIAPGGVKTDMYKEAAAKYFPGGEDMTEAEIDDSVSKWSPLGRPGIPEDISGVVALLASADSQWLTGQTFQVSGGAYMV